MAEQNIKDVIKQEFLKCASDPVYFMKKYYWIQHPQRGRIQFGLYPFQEKVLHLFKTNSYCITNKSRQLGISTLVSAYSLWLMLFNKDKNVLVIATKQETAKNMVTKVRFMYENLPSWLKGSKKPLEDNRLSLKLPNVNFGLLSYYGDSVIRSFYSFGQNNCVYPPNSMISVDNYKAGLLDLKTSVLDDLENWKVFYANGIEHTFLSDPNFDQTVKNTKLNDWISQLRQGMAENLTE